MNKALLAILAAVAAFGVLMNRCQAARTWTEVENDAAAYMTPERELTILAHADDKDVSWPFVMAVWRHEYGPPGYEFGNKRLSWEVIYLFIQDDRQIAQTVRMVRRASRDFTKRHNIAWSGWRGDEAKFQERHVTKFARFFCDNFQQPTSGCDGWTSDVLKRYHKFKGREPKREAAMRIYK